MSAAEATPMLPHVTAEFYAWIWWYIEKHGGEIHLGDPVGDIDVWIDERLAFRVPGEAKVTSVITGDNPSATLEARAALAGGKVLDEVRLGIRRDSREFRATLKGAAMDISQAKLPTVVDHSADEAVYDRMFLYEELCLILSGLFQWFVSVRTSPQWPSETAPELQAWLAGGPSTLT